MLVIIPLLVIFFCVAYIVLSNDIGIISYIVIFIIIFLTLFSSYKIYKTFQEDLKVQEQNAIRMQINKLLQKINMSDDEEEKKNLQSKVNQLKEELGEINE